MASESDNQREDPLVLVHTRNYFYRQKYHIILGVVILSLVVIAALIGTLVFLVEHPPEPVYFITDSAGRLIQDIPLSQPNMSNEAVAEWTKKAVEAAYSYDYMDYRGELQDAARYFTEYGWRTYMNGLRDSDNLLAVTQRKWVVEAKAIALPKLVATANLGGSRILAYKFEIPLLVSYSSAPFDDKSRITNPLKITVVVERQSILTSENGLGIVQMIGEIAT